MAIPTLQDWQVFNDNNPGVNIQEAVESTKKPWYISIKYASLEEATRVIDKYSILRQLDFPVPPTTTINSNGKEHYVIQTDMAVNGKYEVLAFEDIQKESFKQQLRQLKLTDDEVFLLFQMMTAVSDKATENELNFYTRNMAFRVGNSSKDRLLRDIQPIFLVKPDLLFKTEISSIDNNKSHMSIFKAYINANR